MTNIDAVPIFAGLVACIKMNLKEQLLADLKGAMKAKDSLCLNTIRGLISDIKYQEINLRRELEGDEIIPLITSQIKKRKEAATLFQKGNRADLSEKELQESVILQRYLPAQVSAEELQRRVKEVVAEVGAQSMKDMGKVMKIIVLEFKGKADNNLIKDLVTECLGN